MENSDVHGAIKGEATSIMVVGMLVMKDEYLRSHMPRVPRVEKRFWEEVIHESHFLLY